MVRLGSIALASIGFALLGCNQVWGIEPAHLTEDAAPVTETPPDPCASEPGINRLCITVEAEKTHPTYDVSSGAAGLRIDGAGSLLLFLYDKDPAKPSTVPLVYLTYPPTDSGAEVRIDDFPVTVPTNLDKAGNYWIIGRWQDNKSSSRADDQIVLGGDFLTVPTIAPSGKFLYAQVTVATGTTANTTVTVHPTRRVDVDLSADPSMKAKYSTYAVNGDGPTLFGLYDGDYDTAFFLEYLTMHCVNVAPLTSPPPTVKHAFVTTVTGTHKLWVAIEDFETTGTFPPNGTLMTAIDTTAPTATITPTSWTASASAKFISVTAPMPAGSPDPTHCP